MFNKAVLSTYLNFPFPMFLTSWHMLVATIMTQLLSKTTSKLEGVAKVRFAVSQYSSVLSRYSYNDTIVIV
jgi:hypothetical protein